MASTTDRTYSQPRRESGPDETESNSENRYHSVRDSLEHLYNIYLSHCVLCVAAAYMGAAYQDSTHFQFGDHHKNTPSVYTGGMYIYVYSMMCMLPTMSL